MHKIEKIIEGLLFLSGDEGLNLEQIALTLEKDEQEVFVVLKGLIDEYENNDSAIQLTNYGGVYRFVSKRFLHPYAQKLFTSIKIHQLSNASLETLAIIAYRQPITRSEIEEIRGVNSDHIIRKLESRNLIKNVGRSDDIGRAYLYEVTAEFLNAFQLTSLKELPELELDTKQQELFEE